MSTIPRLLSHYDPTKSPGPILTLGQGSTCLSEGRILLFIITSLTRSKKVLRATKKPRFGHDRHLALSLLPPLAPAISGYLIRPLVWILSVSTAHKVYQAPTASD